MSVVSISMPERLLENLDQLIEEHGYSGRSEAMRDGARELLHEFDETNPEREAVCVVTTMYSHDSSTETALSDLRHDHQELVTDTTHSHAGGGCLELFVVEGAIEEISTFVGRIRPVDGVTDVEYSLVEPADNLPE